MKIQIRNQTHLAEMTDDEFDKVVENSHEQSETRKFWIKEEKEKRKYRTDKQRFEISDQIAKRADKRADKALRISVATVILFFISVAVSIWIGARQCAIQEHQPKEVATQQQILEKEKAIRQLIPDIMSISECLCDVRRGIETTSWPCLSSMNNQKITETVANLRDRNYSLKVNGYYQLLEKINAQYVTKPNNPKDALADIHNMSCSILEELWNTEPVQLAMTTANPEERFQNIIQCRNELSE